ncbi:MAG TPA: hypothetical protein VFH56_14305 [Acidimicrobiales bacterium]|nr:hypothetical protein [Acidimicrobiales bacterium]
MAKPDYCKTLPVSYLKYVTDVIKALNELPRPEDGWRVDNVPIMYDDEVIGFAVISEIDGETYDYAPKEQ